MYTGFLNHGLVDVVGHIISFVGVSCILEGVRQHPCLHPLDAAVPSPMVVTTKMPPDITKCPLGGKITPIERPGRQPCSLPSDMSCRLGPEKLTGEEVLAGDQGEVSSECHTPLFS